MNDESKDKQSTDRQTDTGLLHEKHHAKFLLLTELSCNFTGHFTCLSTDTHLPDTWLSHESPQLLHGETGHGQNPAVNSNKIHLLTDTHLLGTVFTAARHLVITRITSALTRGNWSWAKSSWNSNKIHMLNDTHLLGTVFTAARHLVITRITSALTRGNWSWAKSSCNSNKIHLLTDTNLLGTVFTAARHLVITRITSALTRGNWSWAKSSCKHQQDSYAHRYPPSRDGLHSCQTPGYHTYHLGSYSRKLIMGKVQL